MNGEHFLRGSVFNGFALNEQTLPTHNLQINMAYENMDLSRAINFW